MTTIGMLMPMPIFAPIDRPPLPDGSGVEGTFVAVDVLGRDPDVDVKVCREDEEDVSIARESTASSDACHKMGIPSPITLPPRTVVKKAEPPLEENMYNRPLIKGDVQIWPASNE